MRLYFMGRRARARSLFLQRWKGMGAYLVAGLLASLVVLLALSELHKDLIRPLVIGRDVAIQSWVHRHASPRLTPVMQTLSFIGGPVVAVALCLVVAVALWWLRMRRGALVLLNSMLGEALLDNALKLHFKRVRPDVPWSLVTERSYSFPSGHSVAAVVLYGTLLYLFLRWLDSWAARAAATAFALAMAFGIGYSRVYLGAHWPSDVAAGYLCGGVWLAAVVGADLMVRREMPEWVESIAGRTPPIR